MGASESPTRCVELRPEMNNPKKLRAPSFRFFLAQGWETSNLNQRCSGGTARLSAASYDSNEHANLLTRDHREAVANLLYG
jgi:hypothetical protein